MVVRTLAYYADAEGGGALYTYDASDGSSSDDGGSVIVGSGGARWKMVMGPTINVMQFGARDNGSTVATTAINNCLSAAEDGMVVEFPSVTGSGYVVNGPLTVDKRITVRGGMVKVKSTGGNCFDILAENACVEGFVLEGTRASSGTHIAVRIGANFVKVRDLDIRLFKRGFEVWGGVWQRIEHIRARNIVDEVIRVGNVVGTVVEDFRYDTDVAQYNEPATGLYLFGEGCNFSDLDLIHAGVACYITTNSERDCTWTFFNSCSFDTSEYGVIQDSNSPSYSVHGIMFDHCWFSSHRQQAVWLRGQYNTDGITFVGCSIVNNKRGGIHVDEAAENVEIKACTFGTNSQDLEGGYPHVRHSSIGAVYLNGTTMNRWGGFEKKTSAAVHRMPGAGYLQIDGCTALDSSNNQGLIDEAANPSTEGHNSLAIGRNYGLLPTTNKQQVVYLRVDSGQTDDNGVFAVANPLPVPPMAVMAQMDPASGNWCAVTSFDDTTIAVQVRESSTGAIVTNTGPWLVTLMVASFPYS